MTSGWLGWQQRGIALWDVVGEARRQGSLDGAIRGATPNQLRDFVADPSPAEGDRVQWQNRRRGLAARHCADLAGVRLVDLPSSSPAYTLAFADKARRLGCARAACKRVKKLPHWTDD